MAENVRPKLESYLPPPILKLVKEAGERASQLGMGVYLVGGVVRDLFLERPNYDIDLVVEGDAVRLAHVLANESQGKLTVHSRFGTANLRYPDFSIDLATARREIYGRPGALPIVEPGRLVDDLIRRDFSINAMAICLMPQRFGDLIDLYQGKQDLEKKLIRILHPDSFVDDATRILRALRYEQRLDFRLEADTEILLRRDVSKLGTISGDRLRHELYHILMKEPEPEKVFARAEKLGVLKQLYPSLKGNSRLGQKFARTRRLYKRISLATIYLCLLVHEFNENELGQFIAYFNLPRTMAEAVLHTVRLKAKLCELDNPKLKPSEVYRFLRPYSAQAIRANLVATESPIAEKHLKLYLTKLSSVKPLLNGDDLLKMGVSAGPQVGEVLKALHEARLDGVIKTRKGEEEFVRSMRSGGP
ncbi:MAG: CCA tRNA nucleotidyltransferase [Chloroflexi bacterium]|nr:CCA tRNA nucleotidyltransferase [Chloroflexota bacterium]